MLVLAGLLAAWCVRASRYSLLLGLLVHQPDLQHSSEKRSGILPGISSGIVLVGEIIIKDREGVFERRLLE